MPTTPPLVLHDYFAIRGGGERLVLTLAAALEADLVHGYRTADTYPADRFPTRTTSLDLWPALRRPGLRPLALAGLFAGQRARARSHDVRIYSGVAAPFAAPPRSSQTRNIYYCHTPPRFLFDQHDHFLARLPRARRQLVSAGLAVFERGYRRAVARMDTIVTNSENTRYRIRTYLGRESVVVHPPVDTEHFRWLGQDDYYLSAARLTALKRVDVVIDAFRMMPQRRLVVASGGDMAEVLRARAEGAANISFLGWVDDDTLRELRGRTIASIYVPRDEDFGMSPLESMAAGKPVIGVAEGGLLETIQPDRTGFLLPPHFTAADVARAVEALTPEKAAAMRPDCEARAAEFSVGHFVDRMRAIVNEAMCEIGAAGAEAPA